MCIACQSSKIHRHVRTVPDKIPVPDSCFASVNVDLVGPLPSSRRFTYLLTDVDHFSSWPEAIPISGIDTTTVARAFIANWVARFSIPCAMISDRGSQLVSQLWDGMAKTLGTKTRSTRGDTEPTPGSRCGVRLPHHEEEADVSSYPGIPPVPWQLSYWTQTSALALVQ